MSTKKTLELEYKIALLENHIESLHKRFDSLEQTMYALHNTSMTLKKPNGLFSKHSIHESESTDEDLDDPNNKNVNGNEFIDENEELPTINACKTVQGGFDKISKKITPIHTRSIS